MATDYIVVLILFLASLFARTGYELLKEKGKIRPENKLLFIITLVAMFVLWFSWFNLCPLDPWRMELPDTVRWIGFILFALGTLLFIGAFVQLRGLENIDHLVTTGLFAKMRHPMYVGFILWFVGWSVFNGAAASLAFGLVGCANILYWRRLEEARLQSHYGERYLQYRRNSWF